MFRFDLPPQAAWIVAGAIVFYYIVRAWAEWRRTRALTERMSPPPTPTRAPPLGGGVRPPLWGGAMRTPVPAPVPARVPTPPRRGAVRGLFTRAVLGVLVVAAIAYAIDAYQGKRRYGPVYRGAFDRGAYGSAPGTGAGWWPWGDADRSGPSWEAACERRLDLSRGEWPARAESPVYEPAHFAQERQRCERDTTCRYVARRERRGTYFAWTSHCIASR